MALAYLCHNPKGCGIAACDRGLHLPRVDVTIDVHATPSGKVWHATPGCVKLVGRTTTKSRMSWQRVEHSRCLSCLTVPTEILSHREESRKISSAARTILQIDRTRTGAVGAEESARLEKAKRSIEKRRWSREIDLVAKELVKVADEILAAAGEDWVPDPIPTAVLRAVAVELVGTGTDPENRIGRRPATPADREAGRLWPASQLDVTWRDWYEEVRGGRSSGRGLHSSLERLDEHHPGQRAALKALIGAWDEAVTTRAATPGPTWLVVIQDSEGRGSKTSVRWLFEKLEGHALCKLPRNPLGYMGGAVLVPVPEIVIELLPRCENPSGTLIQVPEGTNLTRLAETAIGIWDDRSVQSLRRAFELATTVLEA